MFSETKITFTVGIEIDEDEIEGVQRIVEFLEELIKKAQDRAVSKEDKRASLKKRIDKTEEFVDLLCLPVKEDEDEIEDEKIEVAVKKPGLNDTVTCECGTVLVNRNMNRHKKTVKHMNFEKNKV
jgi:hypothetical protein